MMRDVSRLVAGVVAWCALTTTTTAKTSAGRTTPKWAVAVLLTTRPSEKSDGWTARSVKPSSPEDAGTATSRDAKRQSKEARQCRAGPTLCAVLVLRHTVRAYSGLSPTEAAFVALVDKPAPASLRASLEANGVVPAEMDFEPKFDQLFRDYLLMRKFYVLKLIEYEKVLLLDSDTIVVGSLRHLFAGTARCGERLEDKGLTRRGDDDDGGDLTAACWPEKDAEAGCAPRGKKALVVAQQTAGTPVLTALMLVTPSRNAWLALAAELDAVCGGNTICDRRLIYARGWANRTKQQRSSSSGAALSPNRPREWALRAAAEAKQQQRRNNPGLMHSDASPPGGPALFREKGLRGGGAVTWRSMGAGFTDQGFAEYYFGQRLRTLYSISHRTCKMKYVHFNVPPKPWQCPGPHCGESQTGLSSTGASGGRRRAKRYKPPEGDLRWGGHKCATDWWWQFVRAAPHINAPEGSCVAQCLPDLRAKQSRRRAFADATMRNYTPRCKDWSPHWPPLQLATRPTKRRRRETRYLDR